MRLSEWMAAKKAMNDEKLAEMLGVDRTSVLRWRKGEVTPSKDNIVAISRVTRGKVKPSDWFETAELTH